MKIINIGRNYAAHAKELGNEVPDAPLIFVKPRTAYAPAIEPIDIPSWTQNLHHEVELVVAISERLEKVDAHTVRSSIRQVTLGLDLTARDLQNELNSKAHPWERAKSFDGAARVGPMKAIDETFWTKDHLLELEINDEPRQSGHLSGMMWQPAEFIAEVSQWMTLEAGDLVFTGTPPGVGPLRSGDTLVAKLDQATVFTTSVR